VRVEAGMLQVYVGLRLWVLALCHVFAAWLIEQYCQAVFALRFERNGQN